MKKVITVADVRAAKERGEWKISLENGGVVTPAAVDEGMFWQRSNVIDRGGIGHHAGVTEATIEQLRDGRIWMLMRTNWKTFWEAYSSDQGLSWSSIGPTKIDAGSAPGLLKRLQSGRLILVWNRYYPEGKTSFPLLKFEDVELKNENGIKYLDKKPLDKLIREARKQGFEEWVKSYKKRK